jgi:hypothetical protein
MMKTVYVIVKHDTAQQIETPVMFRTTHKDAHATATYLELHEDDKDVQYYVLTLRGE